MKVSIITVVYNGVDTIEDTIRSVVSQNYNDIEYIIIDGKSTDGTTDIIERYKNKIACYVSEKDNGIYDAMNKGIKLATGDVIGILNSDDLYNNDSVISTVVNELKEGGSGVYGDLLYVDRLNPGKITRYWRAGTYIKDKFKWGWMPPHPTVFLKRNIYERYGLFNTSFKSAADYELLLRLMYRYNVKLKYLPQVIIKMRTGGTSNVTLGNRIKANIEDYRAWKINKIEPYLFTTILKPLIKIKQYWNRPIVK